MAYRTIGNAVVEWDDNEPHVLTMAESRTSAEHTLPASYSIDLSILREGFEDVFIQHLKEYLIERFNRVTLLSVRREASTLKSLLTKLIRLALFDARVGVIDETFLLCVASVKQHLTVMELDELLRTYKNSPYSKLFAKGLLKDDFPRQTRKKGRHGAQIDNILAKALSRSAVGHILDLCDNAYALGIIDIGHYSFSHLAFAVFCRPNSYRQIRVGDLNYDKLSNQYSIRIVASKSKESNPSKVNFGINEPLGLLLIKQRQHVIANYGHLVDESNIEKLALFPARRLAMGNSQWIAAFANQNFGMCEDSGGFLRNYQNAIKRKFNAENFTLSANALRHTVGTLLAQTGASSKTIQAVLKHASDTVCNAYVDIAFQGMIQGLSDAMRPAFMDHLPGLLNLRSKSETISVEKLIWSEDLETGRFEETGACGKSIACENAPIVCYGCFRFRPCWDADHTVNLKVVQQEIDDMSKRGKPFQHMVDRARTAKNQILIVMNAADRYRDVKQHE